MRSSCIFLLILTAFTGSSGQGCVTSEAAANNCSCSFNTDTCCWRNNATDQFHWHLQREPSFMSATANNTIGNDVARLDSFEICGSLDVQYLLQFYYEIVPGPRTCSLSVYSEVGGDPNLLWTTNTSTLSWNQSRVLNFTSFSQNVKLRFQADKRTPGDPYWCQIKINNVTLRHEPVSTSPKPPLTVTSPTQTTAPPSSSSSSSSSTSQTPPLSTSAPTMSTLQTTVTIQAVGNKDSVSSGAIIGIVIVLIVTVVVCVVVIMLIRRRRNGQKSIASFIFRKFRKPKNETNEGVDSIAHSDGADDIIPVDTNAGRIHLDHSAKAQPESNNSNTSAVPRGTESNRRLQHGTSPYEIADIPDSSNYYNVLVDEDDTHAVRPPNKTKTQRPDYELAAIVEFGGDYSTVDDADLEERRARARPDEYAKVKKPKGGNYNKLSFQNPGFDGKAEDTYNHIEDEEPVYKVPRSDGNEYSPATNPGASSVGHSAGGGSEPHYVIVNGKGKDDAARGGDDEYNHLNLRKDPSANVPDPTDRGTGAGVYNHLDDQNQGPPGVQTEHTYNRVNYDGHTQNQNRKQNAGDYSHIGGF